MKKYLMFLIFLFAPLFLLSQTSIKADVVINTKDKDTVHYGCFELQVFAKYINFKSNGKSLFQSIIRVEKSFDDVRYILPCDSYVRLYTGMDGIQRAVFKYKDKAVYYISPKFTHKTKQL